MRSREGTHWSGEGGHSTCPRLTVPSRAQVGGSPRLPWLTPPPPPPRVMGSDSGGSLGKPGGATAQGLSPGPAFPGAPVGGEEVGVSTRCQLVAAAALPPARGPVDDDEAQAHDHEEHPKEGEAGSLRGQGRGSGTARATGPPAQPRDPHPCSRLCWPSPCLPRFWGWTAVAPCPWA